MVEVHRASPQDNVKKLIKSLIRKVPGVGAGDLGRPRDGDGWRVYFIHTRTGQKGPMLEPISGSWEVTLNDIEDMSVRVTKESLAAIEQRWYTVGWGGLLFTWTSMGVEVPWTAGPLTGWPSETATEIEFSAAGLREEYAHLVIGTDLRPRNVSLGHIMWLLADQVNIKPGGLPIFDGSPDPAGRGHLRNYEAWNLANNGLDKRMTELSNVRKGPDVMFRPVWSRQHGQERIEWAVMHGTSASPRIHCPDVRDYDTTVPFGSLHSVEVRTEASSLVSRVWATGSGEGEGILRARSEDLSLVENGFTFREAVVSDTAVGQNPQGTTETASGGAKKFPVSLTVANNRADAPKVATVRIPVHMNTRVTRWRLHIANRNPEYDNGDPRTAHVKFGDLYSGSNWNNGGMGNPEKLVDIYDIEQGSSETVTGWVENNDFESNKVLSFDYETTSSPHRLYGGGWVREGVRDAGRQGYLGMKKGTGIPFHVWIEVEVDGNTPSVSMIGSSSATGFAASTPIFDSPLYWYAREAKAIPVLYASPGDTMADWEDPSKYRWQMWKDMSDTDAALFYIGSNDVFNGASLATLKTRQAKVAVNVADFMSPVIYAVTIPPRTNATGAGEDTRREYNKWLATLPNMAIGLVNFATSISNDDETILPQYNADGMHLNARGYQQNAEAINQVVLLAGQTPPDPTPAELIEMADGALDERYDAIDQITVKTHAFDTKNGMGSFQVGDPAVVHLAGWLAIPDGPRWTRIIKASGDLKGELTIDFQSDVWT